MNLSEDFITEQVAGSPGFLDSPKAVIYDQLTYINNGIRDSSNANTDEEKIQP